MNRGSTVILLGVHFLNIEIEFLDHENMGIDTLVELIVYIVMQILTKIGFLVMAALIKGFWVQRPKTWQQHVFMMRGVGHTKK